MTVSLAAPLDRLLVGVVSRWLTARRRRGAGRPMAVFSQDTIGEAILLDGLYERGHLTALADWLRAERPDALSGTAIDIGANIGNHACFFASLFDEVIAFEPNPRVFRLLMLNTEDRGNVEARNMGLSDAPRAARLAHPHNNTGGGRIVEDDSGVGITLDRLDAQITADTRIGLIKLDIEGHERAALEGAADTIARDRPIVVIEQHASEIDGGTSPTIDWLRAHGYTTFYSVDGPPMLRKRLRLRAQFGKRNHPMIVAECATPAREGR